MNRKAIELALSTLILIIIGVAVLVGLIYFITNGFKNLKSTTEPFQTNQANAIIQACNLACTSNNRLTFCCQNFTLADEEIKCNDPRLEINCNLNCEDFNCQTQ